MNTPYTFATRISGIPCQIKVTTYIPERPMRITGPGFEDTEPPEPGEFEYEVLDRKGYKAPWLKRKLKDSDDIRLHDEFKSRYYEDYYGLYED